MKKVILAGILAFVVTRAAYSASFTQYDLAELLVDKAIAENLIEDRVYSEKEMFEFITKYNLFDITGRDREVSYTIVSQALSNYENVEIANEKIDKTKDQSLVAENKVDQMIANVLNSTAKKPYTLGQIQEMADNGLIGKIGTARVENGKIVVVEPESHDDDPEKAMEILKVLAAHAEANGHAVALTGGNSLAMGVAYAESLDRIKNDDYLFAIRFNRNVSFAMDKEIDGKTYTFDEGVEIKYLYDSWNLGRSGMSFEEQDEYVYEREFMEEDVINALYDGLRTLDKDHAEDLFIKMMKDYRYSVSHEYNSDEKNEFMKLDDQLIYKDDYRGSGRHVETTYSFEK